MFHRLTIDPACEIPELVLMRRYLRYRVDGGTYYFTVVTHQRRPFLTDPLAIHCLRNAFRSIKQERPFEIIAIVVLPDHFHCVIELPSGDSDYSTRMRLIKSEFTQSWLANGGTEGRISESRRKKGERAIWHRRFFEHTVRDEEDLERCVDYIHWNPKKHKLVNRVRDWEWSSFHRYVEAGHYDLDWGGTDPVDGFEYPE